MNRFLPPSGPLGIVLLLAASPALATPLVASSEDTHARVCLARSTTPAQIVAACDAALTAARPSNAQRAGFLVARGDGQFWQGYPAMAGASYRTAIQWDPRSVEAWNGLGWALWKTDGDLAAHHAFRASLAIEVSVQGLSGAAATGRRGGLIGNDRARRMLETALSIDPGYVWALREIGWSHIDDQNHAAAIPGFEAALEIDQDDANALYGLGRAKLELGDAQAALDLFDRSLGSDPGNYGARLFRITSLRKLGRNAQAVREANRLISSDPGRASGYIEKGRALMALEKRAEAIATYASAEAAVGPNNTLFYWYADALASDGQFREALAVIDRGLSLDGADYSDHLLKSYIALELGDHALARQAAEASLATGVQDPWAHYYIAIALVHDGDVPAGLERFELAVALGLPGDRIDTFARELIRSGSHVEAAQLRLKY